MADEVAGAREAPANGNGKRDRLIFYTLVACIISTAALAGCSFFWKPEQWDLVNKVADSLLSLNLLLVGGLLGTTKPR